METKPRVAVVPWSLALVLLFGGTPSPAPAQENDPGALRVVDAFAYDPDARGEVDEDASKAEIAAANAEAAKREGMEDGEYKTIQLAGLIAVQVSDLKKLAGDGHERCGTLRLALDGEVFKDAVPFRCTHDLVVFNLALIDREDEKAWLNLLGKRRGPYAWVNFSLRDPDGKILPSEALDRKIRLYNWRYGLVALIGLVGVLWGFIRLARNSNMLRDSGMKRRKDDPLRPYSLARVQTAWWFFLVLIAFIVISLLKGSTMVEIPGTILGLMGIAGGTFLGSELVEAGRRGGKKKEELPQAVASREFPGFFKDIFSDAGGVAFHRFQMFVWTLVLGVLFIIKMLQNLEMPEFDPSMLALMGISNGTYLTMKIPEAPKAEGAENAATPTPAGGDPGADDIDLSMD